MENSEITDIFQLISEANLVRRINEIYERLKDLDYRELMRLSIDPKSIKFTTKPHKYETFYHGKKFYDFMYNLLNYLKCLIHIEKKQQKINNEAKEKKITSKIGILQKERDELMNWGQKISGSYTSILADWIALKSKKTQLHLGIIKQENEFWEMTYLIVTKIAEKFFFAEDVPYVDEEISRLFKTDAFNTTKRKRFENEKLRMYPQLEEPKGKENIESTINRLEKRSAVQVSNYRFRGEIDKSEVKPCYAHLHLSDAIRNKSTMAAFIEPTGKYRMMNLELKRKQNIFTNLRKNPEVFAERVTTLYEREANKTGTGQVTGIGTAPTNNNSSFLGTKPSDNFFDLNLMQIKAQRRHPSVGIRRPTKGNPTRSSKEGRLETCYQDFDLPSFENKRLETSFIVNTYMETRHERLDTTYF